MDLECCQENLKFKVWIKAAADEISVWFIKAKVESFDGSCFKSRKINWIEIWKYPPQGLIF